MDITNISDGLSILETDIGDQKIKIEVFSTGHLMIRFYHPRSDKRWKLLIPSDAWEDFKELTEAASEVRDEKL